MSSRAEIKYNFKIISFNFLIVVFLILWILIALSLCYFIGHLSEFDTRIYPVGLLILLYAISSVAVIFCYQPHKSRGIRVTPEEAPQLFSLISNVASKVNYEGSIKEVILTPGISVSVNLYPNLYNFLYGSKSQLHIGVGVSRFLSVDELSAVIAHELAHISQPETKYKAYLAPVANVTSALKNNEFPLLKELNYSIGGLYALPARILGALFRRIYLGVFNLSMSDYEVITRKMELEADKAAVNSISARSMLSALCKCCAISNRLRLYKAVVLPYLSSCGYRSNGYWNTFDSSKSMFEKIDRLDIRYDKALLDLSQSDLNLSDHTLCARLKSLKQLADQEQGASDSEKASVRGIFPMAIQQKMDSFLCKLYGHSEGNLISDVRLQQILDDLSQGLFAEVNSMQEAFLLVDKLVEEARKEENIIKPKIMPKNAQPTITPSEIYVFKQPTEEIYTADIDVCPVCEGEVKEDTKVCPHCHELIAE